MLEYTVDLNLLINLTSQTLSLESISQKKNDHPSFLIFVSILTKIHTLLITWKKTFFLKLEFKSSFTTKKY